MEPITLTAILLLATLSLALSSGSSSRSGAAPAVVVNAQPAVGPRAAISPVALFLVALLFMLTIAETLAQHG